MSVGTVIGSAFSWKVKVAVFLAVKSQLELGVRRNPPVLPEFAAVNCEVLVGSLTSTEDCGWWATLA